MSKASIIICSILVGVLALAPFTTPDQAAHEKKVNAVMSELQSSHLRDGSWLKWAVLKGADLVRTGQFEEGTLSSSYLVLVAGQEVARCAGALGMVVCSRKSQP